MKRGKKNADLLVKLEKIDLSLLEKPTPLDEFLKLIDEIKVEVFYNQGRKIGSFKLKDLKIKFY